MTDTAANSDTDTATEAGLPAGVPTPWARSANRLYDMVGAGGRVFWDGELATDGVVAWWPDRCPTAASPLYREPPGAYVVRAKGVRPDPTRSATSIAGVAAEADRCGRAATVPMAWAGVAYALPTTPTSLLWDPAARAACDMFTRADGVVGMGDPGDPLYVDIRYRPLYMNGAAGAPAAAKGRTVWMATDGPLRPMAVRGHRRALVAVVMPTRIDSPVHRWATP